MVDPCGRVLSVIGRKGKAEFGPDVKAGDCIYYKIGEERILCQVTAVNTQPISGVNGRFDILNAVAQLPRVWENMYPYRNVLGGHVHVGETDQGTPANLRINPFFKHVLLAGKTGKGKTHLQIVIHEEFVKLGIPSVVFDTPGDFMHFGRFHKNAIVVEDMRFEDLLSHMQHKHTVVFGLQGLSYTAKAFKCYEVLSQLKAAKEQDYEQAQGDKKALRYPPIIVDIDETEIYAPSRTTKASSKDCQDCLIDFAKRASKFGLGLIMNSQRLPGLHYDVRSQCNTVIMFQVTDAGSKSVLAQFPFVTPLDLNRVKDLGIGQCIITGEMTTHPIVINVRDIQTQRAKDLDFERMLGIKPVQTQEERETDNIVNTQTGLTYERLLKNFSEREIPAVGKCLVIPEHNFREGWKTTLEIQGYKVLHAEDMPGGGAYLIRIKNGHDKRP
jgi:hypothetical protein